MWFVMERTGMDGTPEVEGSFLFGERKFVVLVFWHVDEKWRHWKLAPNSVVTVHTTPEAIAAAQYGGMSALGAHFADQQTEAEVELDEKVGKRIKELLPDDCTYYVGATFDAREYHEDEPYIRSVSPLP